MGTFGSNNKSSRKSKNKAAFQAAKPVETNYLSAQVNDSSYIYELNTLAEMFKSGQLAECEKLAISLTKRCPKDLFGWKILGEVFQKQGQFVEARYALGKVAEFFSEKINSHVEVYIQQAKLLFEADLINDAEKLYLKVLTTDPNHPVANSGLGLIMLRAQQTQSSLPFFKTALEADPEQKEHWLNYIDALIQAKSYEDAETVLIYGVKAGLCGRETDLLAAQIHDGLYVDMQSRDKNQPPSNVDDELIRLFSELRYEEVESRLLTLTQDYPDWLVGWKILTDTLMVQQKDARIPAKRALELNLHDAKEHCYYGLVLKKEGDLKAAASAFEHATVLKPDYAAAYNNLGVVYKDMGNVEKSILNYRQALYLNPNYASCFSNLLFCLSHSEHINAKELLNEHRLFADQYERPLRARWPKHKNIRNTQRCLKIGFVSADFRDHSLAYFFEPILKHLSCFSSLSLHAYSTSAIEDNVTNRLRVNFKCWTKVDSLSDDDLAKKILDDKIDILLDLDGHTSGNRLLTFALKPAPIQASWLGYLATTGLTAIDYYLADSYLLPPGQFDNQFTEKLVQLPANAPFMPYEFSPEVNNQPALTNGYITFGCFNRPNKITQSAVKLWCSLLTAVPKSKLLLGAMPQEGSFDGITKWFLQEGIQENRLIFQPRGTISEYLSLHHQVDICLDTFPSNGVTTTCHAAWMGVPTLCVEGGSLTSRGSLGVMKHLGLEDFVAKNTADFLKKGLLWSSQIEQLVQVRQTLRNRFDESLLAKPDLIAKSLEIAFQKMWLKFCLNLPAETIQISIVESLKK